MPVDAGLASLSDNLLLGAIAMYAFAMFGYTVEYAFGHGREAAAKKVRPARVLAGAGGPDVVESPATESVEESLARLTGTPEKPRPPSIGRIAWFGWFGVAATVVGLLLQVGCLVSRGFAAHRIPFGNMYEFVSAVCVVGVVAWLVVAVRKPVRHLGVFVVALVLMMLGIAGSLLYTEAAPLMPALNSYWIKIHVPSAITASGIFMIGFVTGSLYLIRNRYEVRVAAGKPLRFPVTLGRRLPSSESLERLTFRLHAVAFPIWTVAIILGAIWAEAAWSRYWGWDPKETWAFVSWVVYAAYLHARATSGWRGSRATWIVILGWMTMMVNLFAINLVTSGLHSYAGI
jgi:cytochrome c-type biogenesis protein CcsB